MNKISTTKIIIIISLIIIIFSGCTSANQKNDITTSDNLTAEDILNVNTIQNLTPPGEITQISTAQYYIENGETKSAQSIICAENKDGDIWIYGADPNSGTWFILSPEYYYTVLDPADESGIHLGIQENQTDITYDEYQNYLSDYNDILELNGIKDLEISSVSQDDSEYTVIFTERLNKSDQYASYYKRTFNINKDEITINRTLTLDKDNLKIKNINVSFKTQNCPEKIESRTTVSYPDTIPDINLIN